MLVDMKCPPVQLEQCDEYPWGLKLRLENAEIEKLGITELPAVGSEYQICAVGRVESVSQAYRDSEESTCIEIQITSLSLANDAEEESEEQTEALASDSIKSMLSYFESA